MSNPYVPLARNTLVSFSEGKRLRLALVEGHSLDPNRKPGVGRVVYKLRIVNLVDGKTYQATKSGRFGCLQGSVDKNATLVVVRTVDEAQKLIAEKVVKEWR